MFRRALHWGICLAASSSAGGATSSKEESSSSPDLLKGRENELAQLSPRRIADILDNYIVGQSNGKRAVAIALRNRWRRKQLRDESLRKEVMPKNILLIGPTGVGKTEISRRMARITDAPFIKVEATKYTEVGFKGKDVEGIIEDLYANAKIKAKRALSAQRDAEAEAMAIDIVYSNWMARRHMSKLDEALRNAVPGVKWSGAEEEGAKGDTNASSAVPSSAKKGGKKGRKSKKTGNDDAAAVPSSGDGSASSTSFSTTSNSSAAEGGHSPRSEEEAKDGVSTISSGEESRDTPNSSASTADESSLEYFRQHYMTKFKDDLVTIELTSPSTNNGVANSFKLPSSFPSSAASEIQWIGTLVLGLDGSGDMKQRKTTVTKKVVEAIPLAKQEALEKLIDETQIKALARVLAEEEGVVFIDEIDKVVTEPNSSNSDVSSTGVQQDLLPLVEGSSVTLKDGTVIQTDNILFICSGAFHMVKTSDMLAELQGRLPVRVELTALTEKDFYKILTEPKFNLLEQQRALMRTEGVDVVFTEDGIKELARVTCVSNTQGQNIGARRLHTVLEHVMDTYSFNCDDYAGRKVEITAAVVKEKTEKLTKNMDLAKYLL